MSEAVTEGESVQTAVPAVIATEPPPRLSYTTAGAPVSGCRCSGVNQDHL